MPAIFRSFIAGSVGAILFSAPAYWGILATLGEAQAQEAFRSGNFSPHQVLPFSVSLGAAIGIVLNPSSVKRQTDYPKLRFFGAWILAIVVNYFPAFLWTMLMGLTMEAGLNLLGIALISAFYPAVIIVALVIQFTSKVR